MEGAVLNQLTIRYTYVNYFQNYINTNHISASHFHVMEFILIFSFHQVTKVRQQEKLKYPPHPLSTIELEKRASRYFRISSEQTMKVCFRNLAVVFGFFFMFLTKLIR